MIGANIQRARAAAGMKGATLAAAARITRPWLSMIENEHVFPGVRVVHRIAAALGTTPEALEAGPIDLPPLVDDSATARLRRLTAALTKAGLTTLADEAALLVIEVQTMEAFCEEAALASCDATQAIAAGSVVDLRAYLP